MARKKCKGTELSVFKGREAKLNRAIFGVLTARGSLVIYDIAQGLKKHRGLKHTKYTNVNRRVKSLEKQRYLEKAGSRNTQSGPKRELYQITARAQVACFFDKVSTDDFIQEANDEILVAQLAAISLFMKLLET